VAADKRLERSVRHAHINPTRTRGFVRDALSRASLSARSGECRARWKVEDRGT